MVRKLIGMLVVFCLVINFPPVAGAASIDKPIQLFVNNKRIVGVNPIVKSGVLYVPYRKWFDAMGYKVAYDHVAGQISGVIDGAEIDFWAGEDVITYNDRSYSLPQAIPVFNGQVYVPLRQFGNIIKYSVYFDQSNRTVNVKSFGYGQEAAVKELVTKYYETFSPHLLTYDHQERSYSNLEYDYETDRAISEVPVREFKVTIDKIEYNSNSEATLLVTYIKNTELLNQTNMYAYNIRYEQGRWKIAHYGSFYNDTELSEEIEQKAAAILENQYSAQNTVLSDLRTYYTAFNAEDLEQTLQYTAPSFIKEWDNYVIGSETWEDHLKEYFPYRDERFKLSDERVVFLGRNEAVVQGVLSWSDAADDIHEGDYVYEALIYLEYANGRWTYKEDIDLDQDYDQRAEINVFK